MTRGGASETADAGAAKAEGKTNAERPAGGGATTRTLFNR